MKRFLRMMLVLVLVASFMIIPGNAETSENISVTMVRAEVEDRMLTSLGTDETNSDNRWTRMLSEEYGIDVEYLWTCSSGEYAEKLGLALASGDLPDIIPFSSHEQLHQAYEAGYIQDLKGVFEEYASDLLKEMYAYDNNAGFNAVTFDGFLAAFPGITPSYDSNPILYIRKDWLDNLGLEDPKNVDDLLEIIRAFSEDDPDGNGVRDTYGLSLSGALNSSVADIAGLGAAYGAFPNIWYADEAGKVHFGSIDPEMKDLLKVLNEFYVKGYVDPEFYTNSGSTVLEDITSGKIGVVFSKSWFPWNAQASHNMDGAMWSAYPLVSKEDGVIAPTPLTVGFENRYAVRAGYEHPEVVILMANACAEKIWGESEEGAGYWFGAGDTEGTWHLSPVAFLHPLNNFLIYEAFQQMTETGTTEGAFGPAVPYYESTLSYRNEGNEDNWSTEYCLSENPYSSSAANQKTLEAGVGFNALSTWTQAGTDFGDVLKQIINPAINKMITGEYTEADWDAAVEQWLASGGQDWIDEYQAWYDAL